MAESKFHRNLCDTFARDLCRVLDVDSDTVKSTTYHNQPAIRIRRAVKLADTRGGLLLLRNGFRSARVDSLFAYYMWGPYSNITNQKG